MVPSPIRSHTLAAATGPVAGGGVTLTVGVGVVAAVVGEEPPHPTVTIASTATTTTAFHAHEPILIRSFSLSEGDASSGMLR
jgi:hypothetical protein